MLLALSAGPLAAQHVVGARPGLCSFYRGEIVINGERFDGEGFPNRFLDPGQTLRTYAGVAEVELGSLSVARAGANSELYVVSSDNAAVVLELRQGSAVIDLRDPFNRQIVTVVMDGLRVETDQVGVYRLDVRLGRGPRLKVFDGKATAHVDRRSVGVDEGKLLRAADPQHVKSFNKKRGDTLDGWATERRKLFARQAPGKKRNKRPGSLL